ncbi:SIS domain-containing protein [Telmatospirillum sp.]|uniref:SIS domain-containing protein n=1 Tax=Telmatospirillum sp. TaxID=2079197 RepID=UPI0038692921
MHEIILNSLNEAKSALDVVLGNQSALIAIENAGLSLVETLTKGGRIFSCGNGGSMCDAMHFAEELSGRYRLDRNALPAVAISDPGSSELCRQRLRL